MEVTKTFSALSDAEPLSDEDCLAVSQPNAYNPATGKDGDTRRVPLPEVADYVAKNPLVSAHAADEGVHVSGEDRERWDAGGASEGFTFIINSDEALAAWANDEPGGDYSRVLVKAGTWTLEGDEPNAGSYLNFVDIRDGRTKCVTGESGSLLRFVKTGGGAMNIRGIYGNAGGSDPDLIRPNPAECFFRNVNAEIISEDGNVQIFGAFNKCANMSGCSAKAANRGEGDGRSYAYYQCAGMSCCAAESESSHGNAYAVMRCTAIVNSSASGSALGSEKGQGCGFNKCADLANCTGAGASLTGWGWGFDGTYRNIANCTGSGTVKDFHGLASHEADADIHVTAEEKTPLLKKDLSNLPAPVPVNKGGTGASTATEAARNLFVQYNDEYPMNMAEEFAAFGSANLTYRHTLMSILNTIRLQNITFTGVVNVPNVTVP